MIVVDTNTIAYLYLPSRYTADVTRVLEKDASWAAPLLWRSEFRNVLSVYRVLLRQFAETTATPAAFAVGGMG